MEEDKKEDKKDIYDFMECVSDIIETAKDIDELKHLRDKMFRGIQLIYDTSELNK